MSLFTRSRHENGGVRLAAAGLLAAVLFVAQSAHAALVAVDLFAPGDALITLDTDASLEWLDVTETVGLSYNDIVVGGAGGYAALGFVFANDTQLATLWANAGIVDTTGASIPANRPGVDLLLSMMGCTALCGGQQIQQAQSEFDPAQADLNNPYIRRRAGGLAQAFIAPGLTTTRDDSSPSLGNYLVRPAPEPSTALLMIGGLIGLTWVGRRV